MISSSKSGKSPDLVLAYLTHKIKNYHRYGQYKMLTSQTLISPFQLALDTVELLPLEDQESLIEIIQRRLIERRRAEIARNATATLQAVSEGRASYGTIEDLKRDLLSE